MGTVTLLTIVKTREGTVVHKPDLKVAIEALEKAVEADKEK